MNFDLVAPYYDRLAALVFGPAIKRCQTDVFIEMIPEGKVLILGGGTGWIIPYFRFDKIQKLTYVESSFNMLKLAKEKNSNISPAVIHFIHGSEKSIPNEKYDCIISNFVMDCFSEKRLEKIMILLRSHLNDGGRWYCSEFKQNPISYRTFWQRYIVQSLMRFFFKITTRLESDSLYDFDLYFLQNDLKEIYSKDYCGGFIVTKVWQ
ncbi:MAG: class I SAM-dependent methyltransferase [Bacteroidetes bacterium]|nr:class I SAM-dependent methyltransferase [Bacteroidota bacterium]MDA1119125.1 class I SAM-dependent methyltransferase [Bacteroidota bacterium]